MQSSHLCAKFFITVKALILNIPCTIPPPLLPSWGMDGHDIKQEISTPRHSLVKPPYFDNFL